MKLTKEQLIWIRGVPNRGDEVIGTLEKLGGKNSLRLWGDCDFHIYLIDNMGNIIIISDDHPHIDDYKKNRREFKLPDVTSIYDKEINDAIGDLSLNINYEENNYDAGIAEGFKEGAEWMKENMWFLPSEPLPDIKKPLFVLLKKDTFTNLIITHILKLGGKNCFVDENGSVINIDNVSRWMPVPDIQTQ